MGKAIGKEHKELLRDWKEEWLEEWEEIGKEFEQGRLTDK